MYIRVFARILLETKYSPESLIWPLEHSFLERLKRALRK